MENKINKYEEELKRLQEKIDELCYFILAKDVPQYYKEECEQMLEWLKELKDIKEYKLIELTLEKLKAEDLVVEQDGKWFLKEELQEKSDIVMCLVAAQKKAQEYSKLEQAFDKALDYICAMNHGEVYNVASKERWREVCKNG